MNVATVFGFFPERSSQPITIENVGHVTVNEGNLIVTSPENDPLYVFAPQQWSYVKIDKKLLGSQS